MKLLLENWRQYLNEMIVRGETSGEYVVAFKKNIWRFDKTIDPDLVEEISNALKIDEDEWDDFYDLGQVLEDRSDILLGTIDAYNTLYLHGYGSFRLDPQSSILVKKVVKELGLSSVSYTGSDDDERTVRKYNIKGQIPRSVYHGTSTNYIQGLLRFGLVPNKKETNYEGISHPESVFFTSRTEEALHHAKHTANRVGGLPVMIELSVPDKNLIIPDYDVDIGAGDTGCYDYICAKLRKNQKGSMEGDSLSLSREFGIYGYKGRIPASFFSSFYLPENQDDWQYAPLTNFFEADREEVSIFSQTLEEFGYGSVEYPEFGEDEDYQ